VNGANTINGRLFLDFLELYEIEESTSMGSYKLKKLIRMLNSTVVNGQKIFKS